MTNFPRFTLNRTVVMLAPKQPFLDWVNEIEPDVPELSLADLCEDNEAFLIPQLNDEQETVQWVEKRWSMLFEHMLAEWVMDETAWPQKRTLDMFRDWFGVEMHTLAWDLADEPLLTEDWHEEEGDDDDGEEFVVPEKMRLH
jgi:hypothetical protein